MNGQSHPLLARIVAGLILSSANLSVTARAQSAESSPEDRIPSPEHGGMSSGSPAGVPFITPSVCPSSDIGENGGAEPREDVGKMIGVRRKVEQEGEQTGFSQARSPS